MPNRLSQCTSPYLLQHADNPVDWYPWGEEALAKARDEGKPIFLSIGYSACHWCHVMEKESFESPATAEIMNKLFVNIKVDREERPDIDKIYMQSVMLMTNQGGWPMSVWLTPDLKPFYGGTYFPAVPRPGMPSFAQLLLTLGKSWKDKREEVEKSAHDLSEALHRMADVADLPEPNPDTWMSECVEGCEMRYDDENGGFGKAPKFPQPMTLRFLLLRALSEEDSELLELVDHSLEQMARGGLYDQLGGGFHRYCVDADWTVPHFEKMLTDNALLCELYSEMYAHTGKPLYKWVVETLVQWLKREMTLEGGGFASSQDADSEGQEGKFFVWTAGQVADALDENERQMFATFYGVTKGGNFEQRTSVLTQRLSISRAAKELGWEFDFSVRILEAARKRAFEAREQRVRPGRDDKVLAGWNGLMLSGLCKAARMVGSEAARELALANGQFLKETFAELSDSMPRVFMNGKTEGRILAFDLAAMVRGFFDLYELTLDGQWMETGMRLFNKLESEFWDPVKQLTALTEKDPADLLLRPYDFEDNAIPSAHSLMLECARRHHRFTGREVSLELAQEGLAKMKPVIHRAPTGFGMALQAAQLMEAPGGDVVLGGPESQGKVFLPALEGRFLPGLMVASTATPGIKPALVEGKEAGKAYYCVDFSCREPVDTADELAGQLTPVLAAQS